MLVRTLKRGTLCAALAITMTAAPAMAQISISSADDIRAGELEVPINKSQVIRVDRP